MGEGADKDLVVGSVFLGRPLTNKINKTLKLNIKNIKEMVTKGYSRLEAGTNEEEFLEAVKKTTKKFYFSILQAYSVNNYGYPALFKEEFDESNTDVVSFLQEGIKASEQFIGSDLLNKFFNRGGTDSK
jgi:uncharacterized protein involved in tolerance to divalent cations